LIIIFINGILHLQALLAQLSLPDGWRVLEVGRLDLLLLRADTARIF